MEDKLLTQAYPLIPVSEIPWIIYRWQKKKTASVGRSMMMETTMTGDPPRRLERYVFTSRVP